MKVYCWFMYWVDFKCEDSRQQQTATATIQQQQQHIHKYDFECLLLLLLRGRRLQQHVLEALTHCLAARTPLFEGRFCYGGTTYSWTVSHVCCVFVPTSAEKTWGSCLRGTN